MYRFLKKIINKKFLYNKRDFDCLTKFKDIHNDRIGFLVGNGPSVKINELNKLNNEITFCCNRIYLAYSRMEFRPKYTIATDEQMIEDFGQEIVDNSVGEIFICHNKKPNFHSNYNWIFKKSRTPMTFSEDIRSFVMPGGATLISAMQIGYFMGIKKFYLYGVDHNFNFILDNKSKDIWRKAKGDNNHFIKNYRSGKNWCPPSIKQIEDSFVICDRFLRKHGGWVKNATNGGNLEVLERISFDSLVCYPERINYK